MAWIAALARAVKEKNILVVCFMENKRLFKESLNLFLLQGEQPISLLMKTTFG